MAEKRKLSAVEVNDADKQYLDKSGVTNRMKDLVTNILENRPADPVEFMVKYFEGSCDKIDRVTKALNQISHTHYGKPAYESNVRLAYDILSQCKGSHHIKGITGATCMGLMDALTRSFPPSIKDKILKKLFCRDHEVVTYDVFQSAVFTCCVLQDFIRTAEELYRQLDSKGTDKLDSVICGVVIHQLKEATNKSTDNPMSVLEAGYQLAPDRMYSALATALFRGSSSGTTTCDSFVNSLAEIFLNKINHLR